MTEGRVTVLTGLVLLMLGTGVIASEDSAVLPIVPQGKGDQCVEPTDVMRREHMNFLLHQRDETVHLGVRKAKHSLVGCIDCHVQRNTQGVTIPVNAKGQFCETCHSFAAVRMDCFECHAAVPADSKSSAALRVFPISLSGGKALRPEIQ